MTPQETEALRSVLAQAAFSIWEILSGYDPEAVEAEYVGKEPKETLTSMPAKTGELMTMNEVSSITRTPINTLRFWRARGEGGPRSVKIGKRIMYRRSEVDAWIDAAFDAVRQDES